MSPPTSRDPTPGFRAPEAARSSNRERGLQPGLGEHPDAPSPRGSLAEPPGHQNPGAGNSRVGGEKRSGWGTPDLGRGRAEGRESGDCFQPAPRTFIHPQRLGSRRPPY